MIGETLGSYRVLSKLGEGGMGTVYLAEHPLIGRRAAVKVLLPQYSHDQEMLARFFNEARATATLRHPALVDVFDFGTHAATGCAFLIMDYLEGETLAARLRGKQGLPLPAALDLTHQIAAGASAAHEAGIVHRDLKPENIFLVPDPARPGMDRVRILDFGIAKLTNAAFSSSARTRSGLILGTPLFMSPEQCRGITQIDVRADVYALGCILFAMLTGRPPFDLDLPGDLISAHLHQEPPRPSSLVPSLPPEVDAVVARALRKRPEDRPHSMAAFAQDLQTIPVTLPRTVILPPTSTPYVRASSPPRAPTPEPQGFTTLSRAASETNSTTASGTGRWKVPLLIGTVIVGAAATILVAQLWPSSHKLTVVEPPIERPVLPRPVVAPSPVGAAAPAPESAPAPAPAPVERPVATHVTVDVANPRAGLTVTVDGRPARLPLRLRRDGATHQLRFEAPNFKAETRTVAADRDQRVRLKYVPSLFME